FAPALTWRGLGWDRVSESAATHASRVFKLVGRAACRFGPRTVAPVRLLGGRRAGDRAGWTARRRRRGGRRQLAAQWPGDAARRIRFCRGRAGRSATLGRQAGGAAAGRS